MFTAKFSNKSLSYRLATKYGDMDGDIYSTDICTYIQSVIKGIFTILIVIFFASVICILFGIPLLWLICSIQFGFIFEMDIPVIIGWGLWGVFGLMLAIVYGRQQYNQYRVSHPKNHHDSFIKKAWLSFKNKVCFNVSIEGIVPWHYTVDNVVSVVMYTGETFKFSKPAGRQIPLRLLQMANYIYNETAGEELKLRWMKGSKEHEDAKRQAILATTWMCWDDIINQYGRNH